MSWLDNRQACILWEGGVSGEGPICSRSSTSFSTVGGKVVSWLKASTLEARR